MAAHHARAATETGRPAIKMLEATVADCLFQRVSGLSSCRRRAVSQPSGGACGRLKRCCAVTAVLLSRQVGGLRRAQGCGAQRAAASCVATRGLTTLRLRSAATAFAARCVAA